MSNDKFQDLQNGFYNGLMQGLGFRIGDPFQVAQPSPPLISGTQADKLLWNYFNNLPPASLTQNYIASGGSQFLSNYAGLMNALKPATPGRFDEVVGKNVAEAWRTYTNKLPMDYPVNQFPSTFRNWAIRYGHTSVANSGASALASLLLDPIASAQTVLTSLYIDPVTGTLKQPNWDVGYDSLIELLRNAPSRTFNFSSSTMNSDVSNSWTKGSNSGFFGLWGSSSYTSSISQKFASSGVTVSASFAHVLPFSATPGQWYSSSAMALAFNNKTGNLWDPNSATNWEKTFGSKGNLLRFAVQLIVVDTMKIEVTSQASFGTDEQSAISQNSSAGLWPFYANNSSSGSSTIAKFDNNGKMTVHINSNPGVPIVIGVNVLPIGEFVGHSVNSAQFIYDACCSR